MTKIKSANLSLLLFAALCTSFITNSALAQSYGINHSFFLTDTGKMHTVKSYKAQDGFVDLFSPQEIFVLPEMVEHIKASYLIDDDDTIYTIDPDGYVYKNDYELEIDSNIRKLGGNFFTTRDRSIVIIMGNGTIKKLEGAVSDLDSRIKIVGGNYLVTRKGSVYVIDTFNGKVVKAKVSIKPKKVAVEGGNYLITEEGSLVSFGVEVNGNVKANTQRNSMFLNPKAVGGNFFFDRRNNIHTISASGILNHGNRFRKLKVNGNNIPTKLGNNYFVFNDGSFYTVDSNGIFHFIQKFEDRIVKTTR
jgi:hypothetical protein